MNDKPALIITIVATISFVTSILSLNKHATATGYVITICTFLYLMFGIVLLTKKEMIPSGSIHIILGLFGLFTLLLAILQKDEINKSSLIEKNRIFKKSMLKMAYINMFIGFISFLGAVYYYNNMADIEEYNHKIAYSLQKIKKIKKQQEEIKIKQKELADESIKELENLKIENKDLDIPLIIKTDDEIIEKTNTPTPKVFLKKSPDNKTEDKLRPTISNILKEGDRHEDSRDDESRDDDRHEDESRDARHEDESRDDRHEESREDDRSHRKHLPEIVDKSVGGDESDDELDVIMSRLKQTD